MLFSGTKMSDLSITSILLIVVGFVSLGVSIYFFIDLTNSILQKEKFAVDQQAFDLVRATSFGGAEPLAKGISKAGSVIFMVIVSLILAVYLLFFSPFSRWVGVYFILAMGGVSGLTAGLKSFSSRDRPVFKGDYHGATSSFPSGHASGALVFYGFIIYLFAISKLEPKWKWGINVVLALIAILIGISRVYLGVHFFTDVVAGYLFGIAWLLLCLTALEVTLWHQRRRQRLS
ncbi:phosphatase PAP2 family protein [Halobacillus trueperi]|uniref:phosphatase PAP2 family protein n=1 Tax=Halobacillus trueperi TaxID=156205 RepID=UPI003735D208